MDRPKVAAYTAPMAEGLFPDDSMIRRLGGEGILLAGGGRALLMQLAHPKVAQGVAEHSDFGTDPLERLKGTLEYVVTVVFGTEDEVRLISRIVHGMHKKVTGPGYAANDPELLTWVNATLFDTATRLADDVLGPFSEERKEEHYQQFKVLAESIGCPPGAQPETLADFRDYWDRTVATLEITPDAREQAAKVLRPERLNLLAPALPLARFVTVGLLPERIREGYGYTWDARRQRVLDGGMALTRLVYPRIPRRLREAPKDFYLRSMRRRFARRRTPSPARGPVP